MKEKEARRDSLNILAGEVEKSCFGESLKVFIGSSSYSKQ